MPIYSCGDGKYRIGDGECMYTSRASAQRAYVAYLAQEQDGMEELDKYKEETYNDYPEAATNNAKRVLKWREEYGDEVTGMTSVGWNRANQLANKERLSRETIAKMAAFERHRKNAEVAPEFRDTPWRDNGHVAWLGWGGSAGIEWAQRKLNQIDNKKSMIYNYKSFEANVKDVDSKKGEVSGYFSAFGMVDSDGDIMMPGAFKRSIQDWGPEAKGRVKHLLNHDPSQPLGRIIELKEDNYGLYYRSQVGTHRLGQDFIKMVESGLIGEHSIGFRTLREQKAAEANEIHEVMLFEGLCLCLFIAGIWQTEKHKPCPAWDRKSDPRRCGRLLF
jgi:HK97 family phage prohead protease